MPRRGSLFILSNGESKRFCRSSFEKFLALIECLISLGLGFTLMGNHFAYGEHGRTRYDEYKSRDQTPNSCLYPYEIFSCRFYRHDWLKGVRNTLASIRILF